MTRYLISVCVLCMLTACNGFGKIKNIVEFTPSLKVEKDKSNIQLASQSYPKAWSEGMNWINSEPQNFIVSAIPKTFKKVLSYKNIIAAPVMLDNKIFILSEDATLSAFDKDSNKKIWSRNLSNRDAVKHFSAGGLAINNGKIFATYGARDLVVLDAQIGSELWRREMPDLLKTQPLVHHGSVFVLTISNQLCALNEDSGRILWQNEAMPEILSYGSGASPIAYRDRIFVSYSSGELVIMNAANGEVLWQMNLAREDEGALGFSTLGPETQPILDGEDLYIASGANTLMKLNIVTGVINWKRKINDIQTMNKSGNVIFITTNAKQVAALDIANGLVLWVSDLAIDGKNAKKSYTPVRFLTPVVVNDKLIIVSSDSRMTILSAETGYIESSIKIEKDAVFVVIDDMFRIFAKRAMFK